MPEHRAELADLTVAELVQLAIALDVPAADLVAAVAEATADDQRP